MAGGQACWSPRELRETWRPVFKEGSVLLLHPGRLSAWGLRACSPCLFCPPGPPRRGASVSVSAAVLLPWLMWHLSPSASSGHCEPSLLQDHLQVPMAWAFWTGAPPRREYQCDVCVAWGHFCLVLRVGTNVCAWSPSRGSCSPEHLVLKGVLLTAFTPSVL